MQVILVNSVDGEILVSACDERNGKAYRMSIFSIILFPV